MLAPVVHILPLTTVVRERLLPSAGRVSVRVGQKVSATDVIAEMTQGSEHLLLDVAHLLGVPAETADRLIRCKVGEKLAKDALIAQGGTLVTRVVRAPRPGRVVAVGGGRVLLETAESVFELQAGLPGTVQQLIPDRGAVIRNAGALIQGVWGNGRVDTGLMLSLADRPDDLLDPRRLDVSQRGSILLAGILRDAEALRAAAELPVRGLIAASMHPGLIPLAQQVRYPVLILDGFATRPMNEAAYRILTTNLKREVTLNAQPWDRYSGSRPELFIPLPVAQEPPEPRAVETFAPGLQVRLCRAPHAGQIGVLVSLRPGLTTLATGVRAPAADVRLSGGEQVVVPLANLEVVG